MNMKKLLITLPAVLALGACSDSIDHDFQPGVDSQAAEVLAGTASAPLFDPTGSPPVLPFPTTFALLSSTDSTIDLPVADESDLSDPLVALNQLDGFSTISPISTALPRALDPATIEVGTSVIVLEVISVAGAGFLPTTVLDNLGPDRITAFSTENSLVLQPLAPLKPNATYLALMTRDLTDLSGTPLVRSRTYGLAAGDVDLIDPDQANLQTLIRAHLSAGESAGLASDDIVFSWTFNTQSIRETLQAVKDAATAQPFLVTPAGAITSNFAAGASGHADIWIGTLDVPYYLTAGADDALSSFWRADNGGFLTRRNPMPAETGTETIPVLMSVPNEASAGGGDMPEAGWPVVIFQHGITQNRTNLIAVADALADVGFAAVAIDMPMHGLVEELPINASATAFPTDRERHFNIDAVNNEDATDQNPDGVTDSSGTHFIQLTNLANSRDNLRQAVADLFILSESLGNVQGATTDTPAIAFDTSRKAFVGHSLGGIVGSVFLSYDDTINSATLAMPGSGIAQLLAGSTNFGPTIVGGLASAGIEAGSDSFNLFLIAAQTLIDSGDPANHMSFLADLGTPIHLIEVLGDETVPNLVPNAPFSGTEPMAGLLGLTPTTTSISGGGLVRFSAGSHGSILDPTASVEATVEMQTQMAIFALSGGTQLTITDPSVIADGLGGGQ